MWDSEEAPSKAGKEMFVIDLEAVDPKCKIKQSANEYHDTCHLKNGPTFLLSLLMNKDDGCKLVACVRGKCHSRTWPTRIEVIHRVGLEMNNHVGS